MVGKGNLMVFKPGLGLSVTALLTPIFMLYLPSLHLLVSRLRYDGEQKGKSKTDE